MSETTVFTLRASAREGGRKHFAEDIAQVEEITFANTTFSVLDIGDASATLQAEAASEIEFDEDFVQALEDALVSGHGIYLDLEAALEE